MNRFKAMDIYGPCACSRKKMYRVKVIDKNIRNVSKKARVTCSRFTKNLSGT